MRWDWSVVVQYGLLGPVRALRVGVAGEPAEELKVGSPQQQAVLALLASRAGRVATADELIEGLWGDEPPEGALGTVRTYAFRLRKVFGAEAIASIAGGYALRAERSHVDLFTFEDHVTTAEQRRLSGDVAGARGELASALALWRGTPLAGIPGPYAESLRTTLLERRTAAQESRIALDLSLGRVGDAVSELTVLTSEHPLREGLRAQLMLALYQTGRQAEALGVYADTRRLLRKELGVDPGAELGELHQRILRADPALARPAAENAEITLKATEAPVGSSAEKPPTIPAQLPADTADFTGRENLTRVLAARIATTVGQSVAVCALSGLGGVGKTALAIHLAHLVRSDFPDGQLYVDLRGGDPVPADPAWVLAAFLRGLGISEGETAQGLEERAAAYRSALAGRRVLIVLDNAQDAAQVRPLLPGAPGCAVIVTSRPKLTGLAGATFADLDVLDPGEAMNMFTRIVGEERLGMEHTAAIEVVTLCGYLPLAVRIAAARLASRPRWRIGSLAARLSDQRRRLGELAVGDLAVRTAFELGYHQLSPAQADVFRRLSLLDSAEVSAAAAAALLGQDEADTEEVLESLVDAAMLESASPGRYRYHDLLRLYAREQHEAEGGDLDDGFVKLLDFYLASMRRLRRIPVEELGLAPTRSTGREFDSVEAGVRWIADEGSSVDAVFNRSALTRPPCGADGVGPLTLAVELLDHLVSLPGIERYAEELAAAARNAAAAAVECGDVRSEARVRHSLARILYATYQIEAAADEAERSHRAAESVGGDETQADAVNLLAMTYADLGRDAEAIALYEHAISVSRTFGDVASEAAARQNMARSLFVVGRTDDALESTMAGLALCRALGDDVSTGYALFQTGSIYLQTRSYQESLTYFADAARYFADVHPPMEGAAHASSARALLGLGEPNRALEYAERAVSVLRETADTWQYATALAVLADVLDLAGQPERARGCREEALAMYVEIGDPEADRIRGMLSDPEATSVPVATSTPGRTSR
ncbi:winged helix-turn-helix domain-containing protein [Catenulispora sp. NL8]|uniref:Winged helix-turn-helix domain-containing protein n=1 Tax=Catenulispora pinistramenti TaxID=2705254 RepID=A0ABS5KW56_9ACTN|nr:BTAD domain-containing putative transcriptional regulator [Catenulispora pinistramenti]MBS2550240.1 winged helix-turn-helix domain-containing protein [Catenulispora pinistramenti]